MNEAFEISYQFETPVGMVEKISAIELPEASQRFTCINSDFIPKNVFIPFDENQALYIMRNCHNSEHKEIRIRSSPFIKTITSLLISCHKTLKLRESILHLSMHHLFSIFQYVNAGTPEVPRIVCALLFMCQKYEPTEHSVYSVAAIIERLFGNNVVVRPESILDCEIKILEMLDYRVEAVTPYSIIHILGECAGFDNRCMNLAMYLITLAAVEPQFLQYHPCLVASSAVSLVLKIINRSWNQSLVFWSCYQQQDLQQCCQDLLRLWRKSFEEGILQCPNVIYQKYTDPRRCCVSLERPLDE